MNRTERQNSVLLYMMSDIDLIYGCPIDQKNDFRRKLDFDTAMEYVDGYKNFIVHLGLKPLDSITDVGEGNKSFLDTLFDEQLNEQVREGDFNPYMLKYETVSKLLKAGFDIFGYINSNVAVDIKKQKEWEIELPIK
jgi:hypothetical protein